MCCCNKIYSTKLQMGNRLVSSKMTENNVCKLETLIIKTMSKAKYIIISCIVFFLYISCKRNVFIEGFDNKKWKEDSLGCNGYRLKSYYLIDYNFGQFLGMSRNKLIDFFGNPNDQDEKCIIYILRPGLQCDDPHYNIDSLEITTLLITFNFFQNAKSVGSIQP